MYFSTTTTSYDYPIKVTSLKLDSGAYAYRVEQGVCPPVVYPIGERGVDAGRRDRAIFLYLAEERGWRDFKHAHQTRAPGENANETIHIISNIIR